jgi:hypothetical protein
MCLSRTTTKKPKIAEEDIICYKFLKVAGSGFPRRDVRITAPFRTDFQYQLGKVTKLQPHQKLECEHHDYVHVGFHSFANVKAAFHNADIRNYPHDPEYFVFVCVIPKGAKYFVGRFCQHLSYASDALIVLSRNSRRSKQHIKNLPPTAEPVF